jgi:hypothetical protein
MAAKDKPKPTKKKAYKKPTADRISDKDLSGVTGGEEDGLGLPIGYTCRTPGAAAIRRCRPAGAAAGTSCSPGGAVGMSCTPGGAAGTQCAPAGGAAGQSCNPAGGTYEE